MKLSEIRKYRKKVKVIPDLLEHSPLLFLGLDLPFVVVCANSLKNAVALSIEMLIIHLVTMFAAWLIAPKLKVWQRVFVTSAVSTIMMLISRELVIMLIADIENYAGMYLYLMAVNGVTLFSATFLSEKTKLKEVAKTSLINVGFFTVIMVVVSVIREYLGSGTLWNIPVPHIVKLKGFNAPFFGFIFIGFALAIIRFSRKKLATLYIMENIRRESLSKQSEQ